MSEFGFNPQSGVFPSGIPGMPGSSGSGEVFELSWEVFGELCRALALRVYRDYDPDIVIGIATAGVIPGAVIADILQIDFFSMKITRNLDDEVRSQPVVISDAPVQAAGQRVLLVDEITTSGDTLRLATATLREIVPGEIRTATCFRRTTGYAPDYHALETDDTIVFPWDRQVIEEGEFTVNPLYRDHLGE